MRIGDLIRESRIKGSNGSSAKKLTIRLYGRGIVASSDRGGSEATNYFRRKAGQFAYSKLDCLNGAFGIIPENLDGYETTLDLPAFDFIGKIDPNWFLKTVSRPAFYGRFKFAAIGSRKANRVPTDEFLATRLSIPPLAEQRAIAEVVGAVEEAIAQTEALIEQLKEVSSTVLSNRIAGFGRDVASVDVGSILLEGPKSGLSPVCKDEPPGIGVLKLSAVTSGRLNWRDNAKFADVPPKAASQFQLKAGDFLVIRGSGSRDIVGSGCHLTEADLPPFPCIFPDLIIRLRANFKKVIPEYLAVMWDTSIIRGQIRQAAKSTNGIYKINQTDIRELRMPLPSMGVQREIVALIYSIRARLFTEQEMLVHLVATRDALAQELLSGRLRLPDSMIARHRDKPERAATASFASGARQK